MANLQTTEDAAEVYEIASWGLVKAVSDDDDGGDWLISGPIASTKPDYDGDTIFSKAVEMGLKMFDKLGGQVDWEHKYKRTKDPDDIIGRAVGYSKMSDGQIFMTTMLDKSNVLAQKIWRMVKAKTAEGKPLHKLGYSLLGNGVKDSSGNVTETEIHMVTLAPQPKGFDQFISVGTAPGKVLQVCKAVGADDQNWEVIEAALTTGSGIVQEGDTGGAALRTQLLAGGTATVGEKLGPDGLPIKRRRKKKRHISKSMLDALDDIGSSDSQRTAENIVTLLERRKLAQAE